MYYTVEITFGLNKFGGEPIPDNEIEAAQLYGLAVLYKLFDGGQADDRIGSCIGRSGLMFEPCCVLTAHAHEVDNNCFEELETLACTIAEFLDQRSVLLRVQKCEGELFFVRPPAALARQEDYSRRLLTLVKLSSRS